MRLSIRTGAAVIVLAVLSPIARAAQRETSSTLAEQPSWPVEEVVARLPAPAGESCTTSWELAPRKVILMLQEAPANAGRRLVAAVLDGEWKPVRTGGGGLLLQPTERCRRQLDRARNRRRAMRAAAVAKLRGAIQARLDLTPRPPHPDALPNPPPWLKPAALHPLFRAIPDATWQAALEGALDPRPREEVPGIDKTPCLIVPGSWLSGAQRASLRDYLEQVGERTVRPGIPIGGNTTPAFGAMLERQAAAYQTAARHPERVRLELWSYSASSGSSGDAVACDLFFSVLGVNPPLLRDGVLAAALLRRPELTLVPREELLAPGAQQSHALERRRFRAAPEFPRRPDLALLSVARAAGISVAADYFTRAGFAPMPARETTLGEWLAELERRVPVVHFWMEDVLVVRSRDWAWRHDWEPEAGVLERLVTRQRAGGQWSLEDYLAAAALEDEQIRTVRCHTDERGFPLFRTEADRLFQNRHVLRAFAGLTERQRARAARPEGLALRELTRAQWGAWSGLLRPFALLPAGAWPRVQVRLVEGDDPPVPGMELAVPGLGVVPARINRELIFQRVQSQTSPSK